MKHQGGQVRQGTGFLIAPNVVLTCAHNLYDYDIKKKPFFEIKFYPAAKGLEAQEYKVKKIYYKK